MATFGAIADANPSVLFDPLQVQAQVAALQRNRLLMQNAAEDRQIARQDREREAVGRVSASLLALPEDQRPQAYSAAVADLQRDGLALRAPSEYPGHAQIESLARAALPAAKQFELAEKRRQSEETSALLSSVAGMFGMGGLMGGGAGSAPAGAAPTIAGGLPAPAPPPMGTVQPVAASGGIPGLGSPDRNAVLGAKRQELIDRGAPPEEFAALSASAAASGGVPQRPGGYRDNPGVAGQNVGLAPPTGTINPLLGAALILGAKNNPGALPGMLMAAQGQMAQAQERAGDNARQERFHAEGLARQGMQEARAEERFRLEQEERKRLAARQDEKDKAQAERDARRGALEEERLKQSGVPSGYRRAQDGSLEPIPGGPADPNKPGQANAATESERKAGSYLERMQGAEDLLADMVRKGYDPGNVRDRVAQLTPGVGNFLSTAQGQQYMNAAAEWARAKLRLESGAVIGKEEAEAEARTYFPMPGDSAATVEQKARLRATANDAVRRQAGRAAPDRPAAGGGPAVGAVEQGYRFKGGNPADPASWEKVR